MNKHRSVDEFNRQSVTIDEPTTSARLLPSEAITPFLHAHNAFRQWNPILYGDGMLKSGAMKNTADGYRAVVDRDCVDVIIRAGGEIAIDQACAALDAALETTATQDEVTQIVGGLLDALPSFDPVKRVSYLDGLLFILEFECEVEPFSAQVLGSVVYDCMRDMTFAPAASELLPLIPKRQGEFKHIRRSLEHLITEYFDTACVIMEQEGLSWADMGMIAPDDDEGGDREEG